MTLGIAGSRDWPASRMQAIRSFILGLRGVDRIVTGDARGVDSLVATFAGVAGIRCDVMPADWTKHGLGAGFIRNAELVKVADAVVVFWDGASGGTQHVMAQAIKAKKLRYVSMGAAIPTQFGSREAACPTK